MPRDTRPFSTPKSLIWRALVNGTWHGDAGHPASAARARPVHRLRFCEETLPSRPGKHVPLALAGPWRSLVASFVDRAATLDSLPRLRPIGPSALRALVGHGRAVEPCALPESPELNGLSTDHARCRVCSAVALLRHPAGGLLCSCRSTATASANAISTVTGVRGTRPMLVWARHSTRAPATVRLASMTPRPGEFQRPPTSQAGAGLKGSTRASARRHACQDSG